MRRILLGILLATVGLVGLVLTTCGGLAFGFFHGAEGSENRSIAASALPMLVIGVLMIVAVAWYVIRWLIRASRAR
jgi:uncharacterized membrane protein